MAADAIRIGISACLLGQRVRYDGGDKKDESLQAMFGAEVEFVPVCPEVEMGLGTPREPMNLVRRDGSLRLITVNTGIDHTSAMEQWAAPRLEALAAANLAGYILKADSPSCGPAGVGTFDGERAPVRDGRGLFAAALLERLPQLPVEDERRLADPEVRAGFIRRVTEYHAQAARVPDRLQPVRQVTVLRVAEQQASTDADFAAVEEPLEIRLHDRPFVVIMRTPGADKELAAGFLLAEGVILDAADLGAVEHCRHPHHPEVHNIVNVFLRGGAAARLDGLLARRRNVTTSSSCGLCGRVTIESLKTRAAPLAARSSFRADILHQLPDALRARQAVFHQTGGLHGAALFTAGGELITAAEDVGRHNAVDKVIGRLLLDERLPLTEHVLAVSGRTSFEIVQKAWLAGVEIICAVSAPSSLAIELAEEAGITLLGFARDRSFNVYSHPERIHGVGTRLPT